MVFRALRSNAIAAAALPQHGHLPAMFLPNFLEKSMGWRGAYLLSKSCEFEYLWSHYFSHERLIEEFSDDRNQACDAH
jgi:hypothetical protein